MNILTGLNFFSDFGENQYLLEVIRLYNGIKAKGNKQILPSLRNCKVIKKNKLPVYERFGLTEYMVKKYAGKECSTQYTNLDNVGLLKELMSRLDNESMPVIEQIKFEIEYLQYAVYANKDIAPYYYIVVEYKVFKNATKPVVTLYNLSTGIEVNTRIKQSKIFRQNPFGLYNILKIEGFTEEYKQKYIDGEWRSTDETELILESYEVMK